MAVNNWDFGFNFIAKNNVTPTLTKVNAGMDNLTKTTGRTKNALDEFFFAWNSGMSLFRTGMGIINKVTAPVQEFAEFEHQLAAVGAISQASAADLKVLEAAAIEAGIKTQFSPTEAAKGLQELASAGLDAEDSVKTLLPVLDLAAASMGQLGTGEAAGAIIGTIKSFGLSMNDAANVSDRLLKITTMTKMQTKDFAAGLSKAAAGAGSAGFALNDTVIAMGLLRNTNEDASRAATALGEAMRRLTADSGSLKKMNENGIAVYNKQTGAVRPFLDIMQDMVEVTQTMTDKQRNQFVVSTLGARGLKVYNAIAKGTVKTMKNGEQVFVKGAEMIAAMRGELENAGGTTENFRKRMQDTVKGQMILLQGSWQTLKIMIGKSLGEAFRPLLTIAIKAINGIIALFTSMPAPIVKVVNIMAKFVAIMGVAIGLMVIYKGAAIAVAAVTKMMAGSFLGLNISMGPLLLGFAAVVAAFFALKAAYDSNFGGMRDGIQSFIKGFQDGFAVVRVIFDTLISLVGVLVAVVMPLVDLWRQVWGSVNDVGDGAGLTVMERLGQVVGWVGGVLVAFGTAALAFKTSMLIVKGTAVAYKAVVMIIAAANGVLTGSLTALLIPALPFIAAIGAIGLAFYGLKKMYDKNLGGFADVVRSMIWDLTEAFSTAKRAILGTLARIKRGADIVFGGLTKAVKTVASVVSSVASAMFSPIKKGIDWLWNKIKWLVDKLNWVKDKVASLNPFGSNVLKGKAVGDLQMEVMQSVAKEQGISIQELAEKTGVELPAAQKEGTSAEIIPPTPIPNAPPVAAQVIASAAPQAPQETRVIERQPVQVPIQINLDGKKIGESVATYQSKTQENNLTTTVPTASTT